MKALREALGHTKASTFCRLVEISDQAWNHYEHGRRRIGIDEAAKVIAKTGVSLDWIYRGVEHTLPLHIAEKLQQVRAR
ncbi:helix-turn-helix domain-containing protein [Microvirga aerophila]|uniref:helix-turn-helix domain-containing protein n=1 Tax=Microvirga aerophila TaxID=670291 RepID=UPI0013B3F96E